MNRRDKKEKSEKFFEMRTKREKQEIGPNDVKNIPVAVCTSRETGQRTWYRPITNEECIEYLKYQTYENLCSSPECKCECMFISENELREICANNCL